MRCANLSPGTPEDIYLYPFGNPSHPTVLMHDGYGRVSAYMLATLAGGLLLAVGGGLGLRRSRRAAAVEREHARR